MSQVTKDHIGQRVLLSRGYRDLTEAVIEEISPSANRIKFRYIPSGLSTWEEIWRIEVVEVLDQPADTQPPAPRGGRA